MTGGRRFLVLGAAALAVTWGSACRAAPAAVGYETKEAAGLNLHVVTVNLNDSEVHITPILSEEGLGSSESFDSMLDRAHPDAAITGTFFCVRTCLPTGDLVIDGERVYRGVVGPAIAITPDNTAVYIPFRYTSGGYKGKYTSVIGGGPTLVRGGLLALDPKAQGFTQPSLLRPCARTAVGITRANKLLLVAVSHPTLLGELARAMQALGALHAVSMDGGTSAALSCGDSVIVEPQRRLTNVLAVYASQESWREARARLTPLG
jgi:hypothetical protein